MRRRKRSTRSTAATAPITALRTTARRTVARLLLWAVSTQAAPTATDTRSIRSIGAEAEEVAARRLAAIRIEAALRRSYISSRDETLYVGQARHTSPRVLHFA